MPTQAWSMAPKTRKNYYSDIMKPTTYNRPILLTALMGLFVWVFADVLFGGGMFVFRDAAHFYYPLFQFTTEQWTDTLWTGGQVPLWNPYENLGMPLAANPAASVFYPGKLVFAMPIGFAWAYRLYVLGHLLLAAGGVYRLARHFETGVTAAGVAAISYAFSGSVLQQYCNVIFLVGAAWLPIAMLAADRMLAKESGRIRWAVLFGTVLALMVLGGDPQMAYNAGLLATMLAIWRWRHERRSAEHVPGRHRFWKSRPVMLALAAVVGLILSAVQVLPSLEFAQRSGRIDEPMADRLLARSEPGTHAAHRYHFSVGPWRMAEYVWPNVAGRQYPVHHRWFEVMPGEGRIWTPSLYMGLLPLLLALAAMRFRRTRDGVVNAARVRWLSWTVVLALLAGFGFHGLGWAVQEIRFLCGGPPIAPGEVGAPFGGVYWLMTVFLPGYASFRYPAKLLVVAGLGLSVLAAIGWDRVFATPSPRFRRNLIRLAGLSLCGVIASLAIRPFWHKWLAGVEPDMLFGPLDTSGAANDLLLAFGQTALLCGAFWWLTRPRGIHVRWTTTVALILVAADLALANRWMVATAPARQWEEPSMLATEIRAAGKTENSIAPVRIYRDPFLMSSEWRSTGSPDRMAEAMQWDRDTLLPKYQLAAGLAMTEVEGTMMPADYRAFLWETTGGPDQFATAQFAILPRDAVLPQGERIETDAADVSLWHNPWHLPRVWVSYENDRQQRPAEYARLTHYTPRRVEVEALLESPGMVVLADQFYPGWKVEVRTDGATPRSKPIVRVHRVMRGVALPPGRHDLVFQYDPASFRYGAILSAAGWLGVVLVGVVLGVTAVATFARTWS